MPENSRSTDSADQVPRRANLEAMSRHEKAILDAAGELAQLPAHPLLTEAVVLLTKARDKVADFVALKPVMIELTPEQMTQAITLGGSAKQGLLTALEFAYDAYMRPEAHAQEPI